MKKIIICTVSITLLLLIGCSRGKVDQHNITQSVQSSNARADIILNPNNFALKYAPKANMKLEYEISDKNGTKMKEVMTVRLNGMIKGYICTEFDALNPSDYSHYYEDEDGLSATKATIEEAILVLPREMNDNEVWDQYTLLRVEKSDNEYLIDQEKECAFIVEVGAEQDTSYIYQESLGCVAQWDNATCDGIPRVRLKSWSNISHEEAKGVFEGTSSETAAEKIEKFDN